MKVLNADIFLKECMYTRFFIKGSLFLLSLFFLWGVFVITAQATHCFGSPTMCHGGGSGGGGGGGGGGYCSLSLNASPDVIRTGQTSNISLTGGGTITSGTLTAFGGSYFSFSANGTSATVTAGSGTGGVRITASGWRQNIDGNNYECSDISIQVNVNPSSVLVTCRLDATPSTSVLRYGQVASISIVGTRSDGGNPVASSITASVSGVGAGGGSYGSGSSWVTWVTAGHTTGVIEVYVTGISAATPSGGSCSAGRAQISVNPPVSGGGGGGCPSGSVLLASSSVAPGGTTQAYAPSGWSGGTFVSSDTAKATVSGSTVTGVAEGSSLIYGSNWNAPGGVTGCSLNGAILTVGNNPPPPSDQQPVGYLDSAGCDTISGWSYDPDTPSQSITVHLYKDSLVAANFIAAYEANVLRSDVNSYYGITGNHGFVISPVPTQFLDGTAHTVLIYALNTNGTGPNPLIGSAGINCPVPPASQLGDISGSSCTTSSTTCDGTVSWTTQNVETAVVKKSINGGPEAIFDCALNKDTTAPLTVGESHTFKLYPAADCSGNQALGDVILLWDGAGNAPSGWTCISCAVGDPYYGMFIRGNDTAGGTGGASTANHTMALVSQSNDTPGGSEADSGGYPMPSVSYHTHSTWNNLTTSSDSILPRYKNLKLIKKHNPTTVPAGAIAMFDGAVPSGWTEYTVSGEDYWYLRGAGDTLVGGSYTHTHSFSSTSNGPSNSTGTTDDPGNYAASGSHTHTASGSFAAAYNQPPYILTTFGKKTTEGPFTTGVIAMFDASVPTGWQKLSGSGASQPFYQRFLSRGPSASNGSTGGSATHTHSNVTVNSSGPSATISNAGLGNFFVWYASPSHVHQMTFSAASSQSLPPYKDIIVAKLTTTTVTALDTVTLSPTQVPTSASLVTSNKDIVKVRNRDITWAYDNITADANVASVMPIAAGDVIQFAIHVINTADGVVSGDITVTDTLTNLGPINNNWYAQLYCNDSALTNLNSCGANTYHIDQPNFNPTTNELSFTIFSDGGELGKNDFVTISFLATPKIPTGSSGSIFRFTNRASILYNDPINGPQTQACSPGVSCPLQSPSVIFLRDLNSPLLKEF